ncbi:uncharacterized protein LOC135378272 isoform X3 [Ornithodoros turicata]|uniref:uncharacterized protein LOC135378272 isoform X3 n=1 Tax=Ornithodoros turicata TaxID=34597 RepID=UPI0031394B5B
MSERGASSQRSRTRTNSGPHTPSRGCSGFKMYNFEYFFSISGLMSLCEVILGMVIYSLLWSSPNVLDKFLVTVAFLQWMTGLYIHATIAFCSAGGALRCLLLGLAIAASGLHFIHATRYLLKHKPQTGAFDPEEHITSGIVIKTKISRFRKRPHQVASVENELTHAVCPEYL